MSSRVSRLLSTACSSYNDPRKFSTSGFCRSVSVLNTRTTPLASLASALPALKKASSFAVRPAMGPPAGKALPAAKSDLYAMRRAGEAAELPGVKNVAERGRSSAHPAETWSLSRSQ